MKLSKTLIAMVLVVAVSGVAAILEWNGRHAARRAATPVVAPAADVAPPATPDSPAEPQPSAPAAPYAGERTG